MTTTNNNMKPVFETQNRLMALLMFDYLRNIGIPDVNYRFFYARYIIDVPKEYYVYALHLGRNCFPEIESYFKKLSSDEFNVSKDFGWVDYYDHVRGPLNSCSVGYAFLPKTLLPGENTEQYSMRRLWGCIDKATPPVILDYYNTMRKYLNVHNIYRNYFSLYDALLIAPNDANYDALLIAPDDANYDEKSKLLTEFVELYGYGPFEKIFPATFSGKLVNEPILVKKK